MICEISCVLLFEMAAVAAMLLTCCCLSCAAVPLVRPLNVIVEPGSVTATTCRLFWDKLDLVPDKVRGFFRGYRVRYVCYMSASYTLHCAVCVAENSSICLSRQISGLYH